MSEKGEPQLVNTIKRGGGEQYDYVNAPAGANELGLVKVKNSSIKRSEKHGGGEVDAYQLIFMHRTIENCMPSCKVSATTAPNGHLVRMLNKMRGKDLTEAERDNPKFVFEELLKQIGRWFIGYVSHDDYDKDDGTKGIWISLDPISLMAHPAGNTFPPARLPERKAKKESFLDSKFGKYAYQITFDKDPNVGAQQLGFIKARKMQFDERTGIWYSNIKIPELESFFLKEVPQLEPPVPNGSAAAANPFAPKSNAAQQSLPAAEPAKDFGGYPDATSRQETTSVEKESLAPFQAAEVSFDDDDLPGFEGFGK